MKVKLPVNYRSEYTLEDLDRAKAVIAYEKENDSENAKEWARIAASEALKGTGDYVIEVIQADAETARNCRAWDQYGDGTGNMDVWITAIAETFSGFVKVGAYLSDIWQIGGADVRENMFIARYTQS